VDWEGEGGASIDLRAIVYVADCYLGLILAGRPRLKHDRRALTLNPVHGIVRSSDRPPIVERIAVSVRSRRSNVQLLADIDELGGVKGEAVKMRLVVYNNHYINGSAVIFAARHNQYDFSSRSGRDLDILAHCDFAGW
jgi:hypothetical protein